MAKKIGGEKKRKMNEQKASLMAIVVVLALTAFIAPISADSIAGGTVVLQTEGHVSGVVEGPVACGEEELIQEFGTIAIPIVSILGLLFFSNHRKRREE